MFGIVKLLKLMRPRGIYSHTIDNFPYRLIFVLDKSRPKKLHSRKEPFKSSKIWLKNVTMCGKYSLTKFANFLIIVLRVEIVTTFGSKNGSNFRTQHNNEKICKHCKAIFSVFYKISRPNFEILLLLKSSFREFRFLCLSRSKISL